MKNASELFMKYIGKQLTNKTYNCFVTLQDVSSYLNKRDDLQVKTKPQTCNSFVSPGAGFEIETDIMDIESKGATSASRYGLTFIDNFTKIADVIPSKHRTPAELLRGLKAIFKSMEKPKQLYSDEESGMISA